MLTTPPDFARSALDAAPDAMIIIDDAGVIRFANRQVATLFGYTHDEVIGQRVEMLMPERFQARHVLNLDNYRGNECVRPMGAGLNLFGRRRDGGEFPLEISLSPIREKDRTFIAAAIRDISDRKRVEAQLIVAREAADAARELADRANQGKSRFLATASHDLRQPLQTLSLLNGLLRRLVTDPDATEALSQQEQAIGAMSRLLSALLDISKLESGAIKPEPSDFTVAAIFDELRVEFASVASSKGLELQIDRCQESVHSDPTLVEQILRNLLSNAIKYTRQGSVWLRCIQDTALVRIEVCDTGVGIAADQIPYICDEFYQIGVPANSTRDGYGLGLSIVQRLVKLLTLRLDVNSEVGRGSTFSLVLPASVGTIEPTNCVHSSSPAHATRIGKVNVLIVEDDVAVRTATGMLLKVEGYRVSAVASLAEALQHVRQGQAVDLLISDYHLANGETGTQVIAELRSVLNVPLKAILMTGDTSCAVKDLPRDPYLKLTSKPVDAQELLALVRAQLAA